MKILEQKLNGQNPYPAEFMLRHPAHSGPQTKMLFNAANPFWEKGEALALWSEDGSHLIAFIHSEYMLDGKPYAAFGYWAGANPGLFMRAESWAGAHGATRLIGPLNFKTCYDYRLRLDDFDKPPFWGEPANLNDEPAALSRLGFECTHRYITDSISDLPAVRAIGAQRLPPLLRDFSAVRFTDFTLERWTAVKGGILDLVNSNFAVNPAFFPVNAFDLELLYPEGVVARACPRTSMLMYGRSGNLVGFCFNFADPHRPQRLLVKTIALAKEERHHGRSFVAALNRIFENSEAYTEIAFCLMTEDNAVHRLTKKFSDRTQNYGLFGKPLGEIEI